MAGRPVYQVLEGRPQNARDAAHWIRVYTALIRFLGQEVDASAELESDPDFLEALRRRQRMFQERLDYWSRRREVERRAEPVA